MSEMRGRRLAPDQQSEESATRRFLEGSAFMQRALLVADVPSLLRYEAYGR